MRAVEAGKLRRRIEVQELVETRDALRAVVLTPRTVAVHWAEILPLTGEERLQAAQVQANLTHRVRMRPLAFVLTAKHQLDYRGRVFRIEAVRDVEERGRLLELDCREEVA